MACLGVTRTGLTMCTAYAASAKDWFHAALRLAQLELKGLDAAHAYSPQTVEAVGKA